MAMVLFSELSESASVLFRHSTANFIMKLAVLLLPFVVSCWSVTSVNGEVTSDTKNEELLKRAASQLERLSTFRRTSPTPKALVQVIPNSNEYVSENIEKIQTPDDIAEAQKRIDDLRASASQLLHDPKYASIMQDRIKRSFITGIANKLIGGVTSASGGSSRGSSGHSAPTGYGYGYGHAYESEFDIWDFKKAILNTLIQALKALSGGAIAGGGALIKGGGYLVAAKGRVISSAGDAIASLGKSIASSAIIAGPKPVYGPPAYSYHPPSDHTGFSYDGPPPSADAYVGPNDGYNANYASPSNDDAVNEHAGVLIVKETKPGHGHDEIHQHSESSILETKPSLSSLEDSFGGPSKGPTSTITKIVGLLNSGQPNKNSHQTQDEQHVHYYSEEKNQPTSIHTSSDSSYQSGISSHHDEKDQKNNYQDYQTNGDVYDSYGTKLESTSPQLTGANTALHDSNNNHHSLAYQQIQSIFNTHLEVPKLQNAQIFNDQPSYSDYNIPINQHQSEPLKIPIIDNQQNSLDHGFGGSLNYYGLPNYGGEMNYDHSTIGFHGDNSQLPIIPDYSNYPLHMGMGFGHHIDHTISGGPTVLGVWGRMTRRTSGQGKKTVKNNKGLEIQRSVGYALKNSKLTRI